MDPLSYQAYLIAHDRGASSNRPSSGCRTSALSKLLMTAFVVIAGSVFVAQISGALEAIVLCVWSAVLLTAGFCAGSGIAAKSRRKHLRMPHDLLPRVLPAALPPSRELMKRCPGPIDLSRCPCPDAARIEERAARCVRCARLRPAHLDEDGLVRAQA